MTSHKRVQKLLTENDLGMTGSHQAGIHIPKSVIGFFPSLDPSKKNPDRMIEFESDQGRTFLVRYIHYNNKIITDTGTRDEFRLTRIVPVLRSMGAQVGDWIEFSRISEYQYKVSVSPTEQNAEMNITVFASSGWRSVSR